jgi:hypothetical protein
MDAGSLGRLASFEEWNKFFTRTPCVYNSFALGVGCGGCMLAHKLHSKRKFSVAIVLHLKYWTGL